MNKNHKKQILKTVTEVVKQKAPVYPYYPVSTKYQDPDGNLFIFSVEYPVGVGCITFFMIKKDHVRKTGITSIELAGINDSSTVSVIQVIDFKYKQMSSNVWGLEGSAMVGFRQGQLVIIRWKEKKTQVLHKFNRFFKKQGFMQRATNMFGSQQSYRTLVKGSIKSAYYIPSRRYAISFLAGNIIICYKTKDLKCQQVVQAKFTSIDPTIGIKIVMDEGLVFKKENCEISTFCYTQKQQIIVAFSMQAFVSCISTKNLQTMYSIQLTMPIRKINYYSFPQGDFLTVLPYQDYAILINLTKYQYTKLIGHKCFTANTVIYKSEYGSLVFISGGLDHRICFDKIQDIKGWNGLVGRQKLISSQEQLHSGNFLVVNQDINGVQYSNKYSLGQYENARTNSHDYGFSDVIFGLNLISCPTYDGKIRVYAINYK